MMHTEFSCHARTTKLSKNKDTAAVELGSKGGKAKAAKMTKEERSAAGRKAAVARWAKERKQQKEQSLLDDDGYDHGRPWNERE